MMMSGLDASTCPAECGGAAASRLTEVVTTTVPAGNLTMPSAAMNRLRSIRVRVISPIDYGRPVGRSVAILVFRYVTAPSSVASLG